MAELNGASGNDAISGTAGADLIAGRDGGDQISGGDGHDVLYGHSDADTDAASYTIQVARVASGFSKSLFAVSAPGDPDRLFIVEQSTGRIRILDLTTAAVNATHFLDLPDSSIAQGGEQGLLGLAFHPNYQANGLFYVNLTNSAGDTEIREYRAASRDQADAASARAILSFDQPFANHNGGWMGFGPDGFLYIASGDGGSGGDPQNNAQNVDALLGKMLRIDVNSDAFPTDAARNYAIPAGNPFAATAGADEIWALGLRNPWRASFDTATGDLWIGDVGQGQREEVDVIPAGQGGMNFGWKFKEGFTTFSGTPPAGLTDPLLDYNRTDPLYGGVAVTGGYVYRGPGGMNGLYIFSDFASSHLWSVSRNAAGQAENFVNRDAQIVMMTAGTLNQVASFGVDGQSRLYIVGLDGEIFRVTPGATAGDAADSISGDDGNDLIYGGFAGDTLAGNRGQDTVNGGHGDDWLVGGQDNDILIGDIGSDMLIGGVGNDTLRGGAGDDVLKGGAGGDLFEDFGSSGRDRILDFNRAEGDIVRLAAGSAYSVAQVDQDTIISVTGGAQIVLIGVQVSTLTGAWLVFG